MENQGGIIKINFFFINQYLTNLQKVDFYIFTAIAHLYYRTGFDLND